jgi:hypothetical protein
VRTSLSAFTKASLLSACARNEKLMPTKVSKTADRTPRRWVGLSAL